MMSERNWHASTSIILVEPPYDFEKTVKFATYSSERYVADVYREGIYSRLLHVGEDLVLMQARSTGKVDDPALEFSAASPNMSEETDEAAGEIMVKMLGVDQPLGDF